MPAPFAAPPIVTFLPPKSKEIANSLLRVSVVIIALAKSWPPSEVVFILPIFCLIRAIGNSTPMTPVLQTNMSSGLTPK